MSYNSSFEKEMQQILGDKFRKDVSLKEHCTFKIGGNARYAAFPTDPEKIVYTIRAARHYNINCLVMGRGSNVLFSDKGFNGIVIFTPNCNRFCIDGNLIYAECGVSLSKLAKAALDCGKVGGKALAGLEFAYGIPGSVAGAVVMNAGAYGSEMSSVVYSSTCYDPCSDRIIELCNAEHEFSYRQSIFSDSNLVLLSTVLKLQYGDYDEVKAKMDFNMAQRKAKQPLELPNAGSIFKRHENHITSKLIDEAGLKGIQIGGAMISPKHAGFIVNTGNATANDVITLINYIKDTIKRLYKIDIECEIKFYGDK